LRGADLRGTDASVADAVERALDRAGRILAASDPAGAGDAGERGLGDISAGRVARLVRDAGRPLLLLLDGPEEMPPVLAHGLGAWSAGTDRWLRDTGARLVVACRAEYWEQAGTHFDAASLHPADGGAGLPGCVRLGDLPQAQAGAARARYGVPDDVLSPADACHPLTLRLLCEVRAALPDDPPPGAPGREDVFAAWLDLMCLRVAVRLAAAAGLRGNAVRRLAAAVSGQVHEAARRCLGPGQGELDRAAFEEVFPWGALTGGAGGEEFRGCTGWASAVLAEGLLVPAGTGYRFAHEEVADWIQGMHLDVDGALTALVHRHLTPTRPAGVPEQRRRPARPVPVPRHRIGPVIEALLLLARQRGAAELASRLIALTDPLTATPGAPTDPLTASPTVPTGPLTASPTALTDPPAALTDPPADLTASPTVPTGPPAELTDTLTDPPTAPTDPLTASPVHPTETRATEQGSADTRPAAVGPGECRPADSGPTGPRPADSRPAEPHAGASEPVEPHAVASAPVEPRATTPGPAAPRLDPQDAVNGDAVWWARRLVREVLSRVPDATPYLAVLEPLAERGVFGTGFWLGLPLAEADRFALLRRLVVHDRPPGAPGRCLDAVAGLLIADPAPVQRHLVQWFADERPLDAAPHATVASAAQALLHTHRHRAMDALTEALVDCAHACGDELLAALAEEEPSAVCRAVDRWAHDERPARRVAAAAHALRAAPHARTGADRELLRYTAFALLGRPADDALHGAALALLVHDPQTRSRHLPHALRRFVAGDPRLPASALAAALATHPEPVLDAFRARLHAPGPAAADVLCGLADVTTPALARRVATLVHDLLEARPEAAGPAAAYIDRRLDHGPDVRAVLFPLVAGLLHSRYVQVRAALAPVLAAPGTPASRTLRGELLDVLLSQERDCAVLESVLDAVAHGVGECGEDRTRERVHRTGLLLVRTPEGASRFDRRLVDLARGRTGFAALLTGWIAAAPQDWAALVGPSARRVIENLAGAVRVPA
ncbi:serine protease, partial [Streptomyces sp. NPDC047123]